MRPDFVHNFVGYQKDYPVDYYVFASFNKTKEILTVCGYIGKEEFFPEETVRKRANGTSFSTFAPLYELRQEDLHSPKTIEALIEGII